MAGLIEPARVLIDEVLVADLFPRADADGKAGHILVGRLAIIGGTLAREADGNVGIAFTRAEAVAHAGNQQIANADIGTGGRCAAYGHGDFRAVGVGDVELHGFGAGLSHAFPAQAAFAAGRGVPFAFHGRCSLEFRQALYFNDDRVFGGIDVVLFVGAFEAAFDPVPAGFAVHGGGPAFVVAGG